MLVAATTAPATPSADPSANPSATPPPTPTTAPTGVPQVNVDETVKVVTKTTNDLVTIAWQAGVGVIIGLVVAFVAVAILRFMGRRRLLYREIVDFGRRPIVAVGAMTGAFLGSQIALTALRHAKSDSTTMVVIERGVTIALIFAVTWLVVAFAKAIESTVVKGAQAGGDQGHANRVTTQSQIIRRVTQVIIVIAGLVSAIMTFPSVQFAMGSLLASAGLASVIAGMAARSMLGNVFAGLQLATTDAIRVDDIVVVGEEQGTIEEITLTYVVMRTWDDRRLILPSTHFTENPFANWTRGGSQATGSFTLDLDWRVPIASLARRAGPPRGRLAGLGRAPGLTRGLRRRRRPRHREDRPDRGQAQRRRRPQVLRARGAGHLAPAGGPLCPAAHAGGGRAGRGHPGPRPR